MSSGIDYPLGATVNILFTTRQFSSGAPFTLAGTPVLSAYEDDSVTQITSGVSVSADHDSVTGLNLATVVATGGNGFESGKTYHIVITTGTVDSVSVVGEVVGNFSLEMGAALRPTVASRTLDVTTTGTAGIDWSNVENQASNVNLSVTTVATAGQVSGNVVGNVGSISGVTFPTNFGSMSITTTTGLVDIVSTVPSAATIADAVWDEALADHVTDATFGLAAQVLDTGTATNGDVNNITLDAGMVFTADAQCQDCYIDLVSGVGAGQSRPITAFTFSTRIATVVPNWTTAPQNGTKYRIRDYRQVQVKSLANSVITAASIATDAIGADELAADAVTEIRDAITATYPTNFGDMAITTTTGLVDVNDKTGFRLSATGVDDILDEAIPEPTGTFTWSGDLRTIVGWLGALSRNKQTQSSTQTALRNDADAGDISTSVTTDNGTTFTRGEWT